VTAVVHGDPPGRPDMGQAFLGEEVAGSILGENWISIDPSAD
jgi:hypothetical protein